MLAARPSSRASAPPATITCPSGSRVAVWPTRTVVIEAVAVNLPVTGSYNSAEAIGPEGPSPPTIRTRPSGSKVAVWLTRGAFIEPVGLNLPVLGLYSSAEAVGFQPLPAATSEPPAMSAKPSGSGVAVRSSRAVAMEPVKLNVPVVGLLLVACDRDRHLGVDVPHVPAIW